MHLKLKFLRFALTIIVVSASAQDNGCRPAGSSCVFSGPKCCGSGVCKGLLGSGPNWIQTCYDPGDSRSCVNQLCSLDAQNGNLLFCGCAGTKCSASLVGTTSLSRDRPELRRTLLAGDLIVRGDHRSREFRHGDSDEQRSKNVDTGRRVSEHLEGVKRMVSN
ncbi:hypothetical protein DFH09DRAFT_1085749 [Mycena vulgaris]|nr:hypothetical protein DFH09DRAFT_1085749 [Mycena vulgaris]